MGALREVAAAFLRLGCISFGGPVAHFGYLRAELVAARKWITEEEFTELLTLCQFLPGPASSQLVFALGRRRAGWRGGVVASLCFTMPSACLMIAAAYGLPWLTGQAGAGARHGLKLAAAAVVLGAVWALARRLCTDAVRLALAGGACAAAALGERHGVAGAWTGPALVGAGALFGAWWLRGGAPPAARPEQVLPPGHAAGILAVFAVLFFALPGLAEATALPFLRQWDAFYRAGALVFGGGHVVLPLLRAELVTPGWLSDDQFLAGYGLAQAVPGPLFSFAAYLGAAMQPGPLAWAHGLLDTVWLFLPGLLLVAGALPVWEQLRAHERTRAALAGANATVVGLLLAVLISPVLPEAITAPLDVPMLLLAFAALEWLRAPAWLVVLVLGAAGAWIGR